MNTKTLILVASGLLVAACGSPPTADPPLAGDDGGRMPSIGETVPPPPPPGPPADEYIDPNAEAVGVIGKLQSRHEYGLIPGWYMADEETIVLWVTDRAKVQRLLNKTKYANQVELRITDVPLEEVERVQAEVVAVVQAHSPGNAFIGPDFENYPLVVARLPQDVSPDLVQKIEALSTPAVPVKVAPDPVVG